VQDGGRDRVGAHRHPADGVDVVHAGDEVEHDLTDERRGTVIEADLAEVHVVRGLLATREREVPVEDRVGGDVVDQLLLRVRHLARLPGERVSPSLPRPR
jgi:hypothetical protein